MKILLISRKNDDSPPKRNSASARAFKATFAKFDSHAAWEREKKTLPALRGPQKTTFATPLG